MLVRLNANSHRVSYWYITEHLAQAVTLVGCILEVPGPKFRRYIDYRGRFFLWLPSVLPGIGVTWEEEVQSDKFPSNIFYT